MTKHPLLLPCFVIIGRLILLKHSMDRSFIDAQSTPENATFRVTLVIRERITERMVSNLTRLNLSKENFLVVLLFGMQ